MEVLVYGAVIVHDGVGVLRVDEEVIGVAGMAQVMHCGCYDEGEDFQLAECHCAATSLQDDHGCLRHVRCMHAVVVCIVLLVGLLHCDEEAICLLPVDDPTRLLQFHEQIVSDTVAWQQGFTGRRM